MIAAAMRARGQPDGARGEVAATAGEFRLGGREGAGSR